MILLALLNLLKFLHREFVILDNIIEQIFSALLNFEVIDTIKASTYVAINVQLHMLTHKASHFLLFSI